MYPVDQKRLDNDFVYHSPLNAAQINKYQEVRERFRGMAEYLMRNVPPSRELSCALTQLEQANFSANAGIARKETADDYLEDPG